MNNMSIFKSLLLGLGFICAAFSMEAQGTFVNLNFEFANPSGYPPNSSSVPISAALPGWSGFYGSDQTQPSLV